MLVLRPHLARCPWLPRSSTTSTRKQFGVQKWLPARIIIRWVGTRIIRIIIIIRWVGTRIIRIIIIRWVNLTLTLTQLL